MFVPFVLLICVMFKLVKHVLFKDAHFLYSMKFDVFLTEYRLMLLLLSLKQKGF